MGFVISYLGSRVIYLSLILSAIYVIIVTRKQRQKIKFALKSARFIDIEDRTISAQPQTLLWMAKKERKALEARNSIFYRIRDSPWSSFSFTLVPVLAMLFTFGALALSNTLKFDVISVFSIVAFFVYLYHSEFFSSYRYVQGLSEMDKTSFLETDKNIILRVFNLLTKIQADFSTIALLFIPLFLVPDIGPGLIALLTTVLSGGTLILLYGPLASINEFIGIAFLIVILFFGASTIVLGLMYLWRVTASLRIRLFVREKNLNL